MIYRIDVHPQTRKVHVKMTLTAPGCPVAGTLPTEVERRIETIEQVPSATVEQMRAALQAAGNPSQIVLYPDTPHGFHADYRASYRQEQAQDGWKRPYRRSQRSLTAGGSSASTTGIGARSSPRTT